MLEKKAVLDDCAQEAITLAKIWQNRANQLLTHEEKGIQEQMLRLVTHPLDKAILTQLIDQSFRSESPARVADQIDNLIREYGVPDFFTKVEKLLVQMFIGIGKHVPSLLVPKMIDKMRHDSSRAIIPGEDDALHAHLLKRKKQGIRMNINHLGEALLGENEAVSRMNTYLMDLQNPEIEYISIKISTLYSQINSLAFEQTLNILKERLARLLKAAGQNFFIRHDGQVVPKFINLDMEEYRDLEITAALFEQTLNQEIFKYHSAGIALQAYLPDSFAIQQHLTEWAKQRVADGGSPIKIRIVKGANMEMEMVESAIRNWQLAPYDNKREVDANFKRMVSFGMIPENIQAVHLGIASHNLFELAYSDALARHHQVTPYFSFEMLEGMADHVRRAISETSDDLVLYAPVATKEQFINAIAYLIRRLDENTSKENFLRYSFHLKTDSSAWQFLQDQFVESLSLMETAGTTPHRNQDRMQETFSRPKGSFHEGHFENEPDTDWSLAANRRWAKSIRDKWMKGADDEPITLPVVAGGEERIQEREIQSCFDPNRLPEKICVARFASATATVVDQALGVAKADPDGWRNKRVEERHEILSKVATKIRKARGDLIGSAAATTGKIFTEADPEVSEAIDFLEYYPFSMTTFTGLKNLNCRGKGVGVVISPWNFPIAIPCGGIAAALAAGNTVIFKPASAAVLVAWQLCQCFWRAGVSKNTLQFLPGSGAVTGKQIAGHPDIDFVILTGGTETGLKMLQQCPDLQLAAETGGKNATIITAMSDRDQAIGNVIYSTFGNSGQKCSATSLLILEDEVYNSTLFKKHLVGAAKSLSVGSAWHFENKVGPLIQLPSTRLKEALTQLEPGESWALEPKNLDHNPCLWSPGIKWGVTPGSITHMTEFFGPVLGVMHAKNLDHAIELANQTGYGLTSGLESLDRREQEKWKTKINVGNLYINRGTTGAVVLRQPFGGMGKSALGAGIKVGYSNYLAQFMVIKETGPPATDAIQSDHPLYRLTNYWKLKLHGGQFAGFKSDIQKVIFAVRSYLYQCEQEFFQKKDYFHIRGQDNLLTYLPITHILVRVHPDDTLFDVLARVAAAKIAGCHLTVSLPPDLDNKVAEFLFSHEGRQFVSPTPIMRQSDPDLMNLIPSGVRIRYAASDRAPNEVLQKAAETGAFISRTPVMMEGRIELLQYFQNQSISDMYHRYGNLGDRAMQS